MSKADDNSFGKYYQALDEFTSQNTMKIQLAENS